MRPRVVIYTGSPRLRRTVSGRVPEWPMGTDCKSAAFQLRWFESTRAHQKCSAYESTLGFLFYKKLKFHFLGWIRTAAEPTATTTSAASGGSSEELLGPRPAIRKQGAADAGCRNPSACGGNREARLGQRSDFSRPRQGVAEKSASATRKARRHTSRRQKGPCGAFLDARLA